MPFVSKAQQRKCYALKARGQAKGWDCDEWSEETDFDKLPEKKEKKKEARALLQAWLRYRQAKSKSASYLSRQLRKQAQGAAWWSVAKSVAPAAAAAAARSARPLGRISQILLNLILKRPRLGMATAALFNPLTTSALGWAGGRYLVAPLFGFDPNTAGQVGMLLGGFAGYGSPIMNRRFIQALGSQIPSAPAEVAPLLQSFQRGLSAGNKWTRYYWPGLTLGALGSAFLPEDSTLGQWMMPVGGLATMAIPLLRHVRPLAPAAVRVASGVRPFGSMKWFLGSLAAPFGASLLRMQGAMQTKTELDKALREMGMGGLGQAANLLAQYGPLLEQFSSLPAAQQAQLARSIPQLMPLLTQFAALPPDQQQRILQQAQMLMQPRSSGWLNWFFGG